MTRSDSDPLTGADTLIDVLARWAAVQGGKRLFTFQPDGEADGEGAAHLTYAELDRQVRALGKRLRDLGLSGERALLLYPPGLDFIAAYLGSLAGGLVAVPSHLPRPNRPMPRLQAVVRDARPRVILTVTTLAREFDRWVAGVPELVGLPCLATDDESNLDLAAADHGWAPTDLRPERLAFLQYTSGSTATPKGVMVSHANLMRNSELIHRVFGTFPGGVGVCWLPAFHDMGLIGGVLQPMYCGGSSLVMSPVSFLQRPARWLQAISRTGALISGGPNFAYELCARKITAEQKAGLDLSTWRTAFNGAEPIRAETLDLFAEAFAACGFRRDAFLPCYGLAEGTLIVSGKPWDQAPVTRTIRSSLLERGRAVPVAADGPDARTLVGSGLVTDGQRVAIVDPETHRERGEGEVGEVWVQGPSVAQGYWDRPAETEGTFQARLDQGDGPFLRTGDLGFSQDGELFITGRLKDLIIVRGRNIYPQDVEATVEDCHPLMRPASGGVFAIDVAGEERVVVVQEVDRPSKTDDVGALLAEVRAAVAEAHEIDLHAVRLVKALTVPKTSSGKVQRHACREQFLAGDLDVVAGWDRGEEAPVVLRSVPDAPLSRQAEAIADWLGQRVAALLGCAPDAVDQHAPFATFGLGSAQAVGIAGDLEGFLERRLPPTLLYEYPSIEALARHLGEAPSPQDARPLAMSGRPLNEPIAIIGIGCRFPGAHGPEAFWDFLRGGRDAVGACPEGRRDGQSSRPGGFLDRVDGFDTAFFGISPREAARMDPQHRLLLETAWEALEDAGLVPDRLRGQPVGSFIGIATNDYGRLLQAQGDGGDSHTITGNAVSMAANRLSYLFDWQGPSLAVDTACSSSLVAVHLACQALRCGEATLALAGGVNLLIAPEVTDGLARGGFLASDDRCKVFDAQADGYARGEGLGLVVLKPLAQALADGDPIQAVIRGSATNQDGRTNGLTAPNPRAQEAVLRAAYRVAGVDPGRIDYVEAHGTGTLLGDPIEARALGKVLAEGRPEGRPCWVGSVKSNIGHLEAAAGIAGLIKTVLALRHRALPASLHFHTPNPHIPFAELPLRVVTETTAWDDGAAPRLAGVSSFGFGGTNAHVVLEEAPARALAEPAREAPAILPISAGDPEALRSLATSIRATIATEGTPLGDVGYTLARHRAHHDHRLAIAAHSAGEAIESLDAFLRGDDRPGFTIGTRKQGQRGGAVFVFSGLGTLWPGAGLALLDDSEAFATSLREAERAVSRLTGWSVIDVLRGGPEAARLGRVEHALPTLFALQTALAAHWRWLGVAPSAVIGHGAGEVAAAHVAGVLDLSEAARVAVALGRQLAPHAGPGRLAVVALPVDEVRRRLRAGPGGLGIAAINGPASTTIGGGPDQVAEFVAAAQDDEVFARVLDIDVAPHVPEAAAARVGIERDLHGLKPGEAVVPFAPGRTRDAAHWARLMTEPIVLEDALAPLRDGPRAVFLEIGPAPSLGGPLRGAFAGSAVLSSLQRGRDGRETTRQAVAGLYAAGLTIDWERVCPRGRLVSLPTYPFRRERHWFALGDRLATRRAYGESVSSNGKHPAEVARRDSQGPALINGRHDREENRLPIAPVPDAPHPTPERGGLASSGDWRSLERGPRRAWLVKFLREKVAEALELDTEKVELDQPLDTLGLDSITAMELKWAIEDALQKSVSMKGLMSGPTIDQLADKALELLDEEDEPTPVQDAAPGRTEGPADVSFEDHPLSRGQESQWYIQKLHPESVAFNMAGAARYRQPLDSGVLRRALQAVVDRHEALRTHFPEVDGKPVQRVFATLPAAFEVVDVSGQEEADVLARLTQEARRPMGLESGPLYRFVLFSRADDDHFLLQCFHHIIGDFWSIALVMDELGKRYTALMEGRAADLPPLSASFLDFAHEEARRLTGPQGDADWSYWKEQLAGASPGLALPTSWPRPQVLTDQGATRRLRIDGDLTRRFESVASDAGASLYVACLAAFQTLLARLCGQDDVIVGSPVAVRDRREMASVVGYMINTLPMRARFDDDPSFLTLVDRVKHAVFDGIEHQRFPVAEIIERLDLPRDPSRSPLFQVTFVFQKAQRLQSQGLTPFGIRSDGAQADLHGHTLESLPLDMRATQFELTMMVAEREGGLAVQIEYRVDLFEEAAIDRMLERYRSLLAAIVAHPDRPVSELDVLPVAERAQVLQGWNDTAVDHPRDRCLHHLFQERAARIPDAVAVVDPTASWTYRELAGQARRVADHLQAAGAGPGTLVGVCLDRSVALVGALLGVLEAGAAYVPLDPSYPAERLDYLLEDSQAPIVLTRRSLAGRLAGSADKSVLYLEDLIDLPGAPGRRSPEVTPEAPAYVIYTSGSTGKPKGVVVSHANAVHSTQARLLAYPEPLTGYLLLSSFAFDSSVAGIFWTLAAGGKLVLPPDAAAADPLALARLADEHRVSHVLSVPSLHGLLLSETPADSLGGLRVAIVAGETCPRSLVQRHHERLPQAALYNEYGPTEASVWCTFARCEADEDRPVPIGRPIPNARVYVLDRHRQPVPIGVTGELYVGGEGVAIGYLRRPALTAERFLPDPFAHDKAARMYRTGDLARWREDGQLEFLGRGDDQVKVRGFRIEPGEVEDALARHPAVKAAAVAVRNERLVGYVVPEGEVAPTPPELIAWLRGQMPEHMVPATYMVLAALPLSANGKVDRRALPQPDEAARVLSTKYQAPRSDLEARLAAIVAEVLESERVGVDDNLFELGLDSIRGVQVASRARRAGIDVEPAALFRHPTIASLAEEVLGATKHPVDTKIEAPSRVPPLTGTGIADAYPLSPVQQGMLFHSMAAPESGAYVEQFTCELRGPLDVGAFTSALDRLFQRHAVLRTSVRWLDGDRVVQVVHEDVKAPLIRDDWSGLSVPQRTHRLEDLLEDDRRKGFQTTTAPLARAQLIKVAPDRHQFVWSNHHILLDGWCLPMVLEEVLALYQAGRLGVEPRLPERRPYRDYIEWLGRRDVAQDESYWRYTLAGFRTATPLGIGRATRREGLHETREVRLGREHTAALVAKGRAHHLTLNTFVQGAWALLLSRYAGQDDIVFGVTVAGRPPELMGVESMVGLFINTLPLRLNVDEEAEVLTWLHAVQARNLELRAHEATPLTQVQAWSDVPRGRPLFESILVFEDLPGNARFEGRGGGDVTIVNARFVEHTSFPMTLYAVPGPELTLRVDHDADRFDGSEVDRLLGHLRTLLHGLAMGQARRLGDLPWLTEVEEARLLGRWTDPATTRSQLDDDDLPDLDGLSEEELDALIDELT